MEPCIELEQFLSCAALVFCCCALPSPGMSSVIRRCESLSLQQVVAGSLGQQWRMMACGAAVGEMALFSGLRRTARVEAIMESSIAVITFADLTERCSPTLSAKVRTG